MLLALIALIASPALDFVAFGALIFLI